MSEPSLTELYRAGVERHLTLAAELTEADGAVVTAACPGWTVRQVYAHLAGGAADMLSGRVEGAPGDAWTARHVGERDDRTLAEIVAEYAELGPKLAEALETFPIPQLPLDQWAHEQDVRGALGRPGSRGVPVVTWAAGYALGALATQWGERPALRLRATSGEAVLGDGEPVATFATDDFELLRGLLGRRSRAQLRAWAEPGSDPDAVETAVAELPFFKSREQDLVE